MVTVMCTRIFSLNGLVWILCVMALGCSPAASVETHLETERGCALKPHGEAQEAVDIAGMVYVAAGPFVRGTNDVVYGDVGPVRTLLLDAFWMDVYEVTVDQYAQCVRAQACTEPQSGGDLNWGRPDRGLHPINGVNWMQAVAYCKWVGKRLPTEAQWEKAARGADGWTFPWGEEKASCERAVMDDDGYGCGKDSTWEVGAMPSGVSPYGVHNMAGNVSEWTADWYGVDYYGRAPECNPQGPSSGSKRVVRGESWYDDFDAGQSFSRRLELSPWEFHYGLGFRCARSSD